MDSEVKSSIIAPLGSGSGLEGNGSGERDTGDVVVKRRAPIACKRCRRMRSKCIHDKKPPCKSCKDAGLGADLCIFPVRGQPDKDREYRHPRTKAEKGAVRTNVRPRVGADPSIASVPTSSASGHLALGRQLRSPEDDDPWQILPALPEIMDAVTSFVHHYFQLGFIPKQMFMERLRTDHRSISPFLLLGIISISARFTPSLVKQYRTGIEASEVYIASASRLALKLLYDKPSLQTCQGFYLLSIAQQGSGLKNASFLNLGIAMRMAALMQLHREDTYHCENPTKEWIVNAESARRTLWMLHSQDNLHSGPSSPVSMATCDITALLPCNEEDFANGCVPKARAALADTPPAKANPSLTTHKSRSLFASLIQAHYFWGKISRRAVSQDNESSPWHENSDYAKTVKELNAWEESLPDDHQFSCMLLKGYKVDGLDLAYLAVTMVVRLCNIVLRKPYMHMMLPGKSDKNRAQFWTKMSSELFTNVHLLYDQIDAKFKDRAPNDGTGAQIMAFCVYSCGILSAHLCKNPNICPNPMIAKMAPTMLSRCLDILVESQATWPLATNWRIGLESFARGQKSSTSKDGTMADGKDPVPQPLQHISATSSPVEKKPFRPEDTRTALSQGHAPRKDPHHELHPMPNTFIEPASRFTAINAQPSHFQSQHQQPQHHQHSHDHQQPPHHHQQHHHHQHRPMQEHHPHHLSQQQQQQMPPQHHPAEGTRESHPNGINLLLEVLETHPNPIGGAGGHTASATVNHFAGMGSAPPHHHPQHDLAYYSHADGYTDSLMSYISENQAHAWVPPGALYSYVNVSEGM
ncbi:hypothetical protein MCOR25_004345 [Pyricularia grisea]|uniref:Zn(2)-C6 fungal-type domain-containing protein n=1 Tax=Pyricularia grisea TaxID=148305 RepID=A0A6P8BF89_PYRGI|nr:uncharacterized protein PgNI_00327 [Pyricularia grisea]KAI6370003.1 hypothetical protein MCOR25_004345 [Pyricularia grisea]TLD15380.1 hypothetical protein PgNI_00327 [Pyricularia grisea]